MPYRRSWGAALLRAGGAALLVPVGLLLVVAVASGISGGGLGGLGQLTRGPELPGMSVAGAGSAAPLDGDLPALPSRRRARAASRPAPVDAGGESGSAPRTAGGGSPRAPLPSGSGSTKVTPQTGTPTPLAPATTTAPPPSASPPASPTPRNPLRELVQTVQGVVTAVPLVGPPVADAVGSITDLLPPPAVPRRLP